MGLSSLLSLEGAGEAGALLFRFKTAGAGLRGCVPGPEQIPSSSRNDKLVKRRRTQRLCLLERVDACDALAND